MLALLLAVSACGLTVDARPSLAAWGPASRIASSRVWQYGRPQLARDSSGEVVLAWEREESLEETLPGIEASTQRNGGAWSTAVVLAGGRHGSVFEPHVAIDSHGDATAVWQSYAPVQGAEAATLARAGRWSRPVRLAPFNGGQDPQVAVNASGKAVAVFSAEARPRSRLELARTRGSRGASEGEQVRRDVVREHVHRDRTELMNRDRLA
jgi:hypothetical protein